ncbi:MAG: FHA domain-containing protein, partial [Phycisphaerae bacterium]
MNQDPLPIDPPPLELPENAPQLRITAGAGLPTQKTWCVRRPVTLIGSRRPAHIVLHDKSISPAHCAIVNTGTEILLKDLHSREGTRCADKAVDITELSDGDIISVGATRIQVAIQTPLRTASRTPPRTRGAAATRWAAPVTVSMVSTEQTWTLRDVVAVIGRHERAEVRLDAEDVARRHALIFRLGDGAAIFDLGGPGGICVNGRQRSPALLKKGDRITVGAFGLQFGSSEKRHATAGPDPSPLYAAPPGPGPAQDWSSGPSGPAAPISSDPATGGEFSRERPQAEPFESSSGMSTLQKEISESWNRLNTWASTQSKTQGRTEHEEPGVDTREGRLDQWEAELRGKLHDLTTLSQRLAERERDLAVRTAELERHSVQV